jgi:hypothetical protein
MNLNATIEQLETKLAQDNLKPEVKRELVKKLAEIHELLNKAQILSVEFITFMRDNELEKHEVEIANTPAVNQYIKKIVKSSESLQFQWKTQGFL